MGSRIVTLVLIASAPAAHVVSAQEPAAHRQQAAYGLRALGYSEREIDDIVSGRLPRRAVDAARQMVAAGVARETAAKYLDRQIALAETKSSPPPVSIPADPAGPFDRLIDHHAGVHGVDPALVRAVMGAESSFDPDARSPAGAIGLMQLMPATSRELGVDPFVVEQNIEGGIRYLAQQLAAFGVLEHALVAYNAGPAFARRYISGRAPLYDDTRRYLARILRELQTR